MLTRLLGSLLSPGGERGGLSILIFHRVHAVADPLFPGEIDAARFDALLGRLAQSFAVLPLDRAVASLAAGTLPSRALAISFDDGYADNFTVALPLLRKHGLNATFFITTGALDGGRMWNDTVIETVRHADAEILDLHHIGLGFHPLASLADRRIAIDRLLAQLKYLPFEERADKVAALLACSGAVLPDDLMMTGGQVRALHASGMGIGGHTQNHPILAEIDDQRALDEIADGKSELEGIIGESVPLFAYPNGKPGRDYAARHADMVRKAGFVGAVTTSPGMARCGADVFQLPRFTPWDRSPLKFGLRLVDNMRSAGQVAA